MTSESESGSELSELTHEVLREAVAGGANYLRVKTTLQPADGPGGKVYPPTYAGPEGSDRDEEARYHVEERRRDGEVIAAAVLDSVPSQANRAEEALLQANEDGLIEIPIVEADFSVSNGESACYDGIRPGRLTALEASHRVADATFRECKLDGEWFRESAIGKAIFGSSERDAADMYRYCPTVLVFGAWDSMGGDASRGHKFERRVVSEIIAVDIVVGRSSSSRLDPLKIESAAPIYKNEAHAEDASASPWTTDIDSAEKDPKGKPVLYGSGKGKGKISGLGLSNVTPSVAAGAEGEFSGTGGVTFSYAEQSTVIAINAVRQLRFPRHSDAAVDARTSVAALALAATVLRDAGGYALRSRCLLVPEGPPRVELVDAYGGARAFAPVTPDAAARLLRSAVDATESAGLTWQAEPVVLAPSDNLRRAVRERKAVDPEEQAGR